MPLEFGSFRREDRPGYPGPVLFWRREVRASPECTRPLAWCRRH